MALNQTETLDLVAQVLDRLANGEEFSQVVDETGVTARVAEARKLSHKAALAELGLDH